MHFRVWLCRRRLRAGEYTGVLRVIRQLLLIVLLAMAIMSGVMLFLAPPRVNLTPPLGNFRVIVKSDTDGVWLMFHTKYEEPGPIEDHTLPGLLRSFHNLHLRRVTLPGFFFHWEFIEGEQVWWNWLRCSGGVNLWVPIMLAAMTTLLELVLQKRRANMPVEEPADAVAM